jgi:PAS domain S-box-containing protein
MPLTGKSIALNTYTFRMGTSSTSNRLCAWFFEAGGYAGTSSKRSVKNPQRSLFMSWSQPQQGEDAHDQMTVLVGSAIQLLRGESGVFVVSNEAFDPQSSTEYTFYHLNKSVLPLLLSYVQEGMQPNSLHPLVKETLTLELAQQFGLALEVVQEQGVECCSLALYDEVGPLGIIHFLRLATLRSCFERTDADDESYNSLQLFVTQLATSLRFALRSQALVKEQGRLAAIFQHSTEGILTVDNALRIIDFNPAMQQLTGWRESEVLGQFYFKVLRPKDRQGNDLGLQDSVILQAFAGEEVVNREMIICARDGLRFAVSITASCVRSAHGEPMNGILNIHDLTREHQQEEQRSTFISVISHELQTPISIIKGYASTLARADANFDAGTIRARLLAIEDEADRLNKLVVNLLYASRIQAHGLLMDVASLDLEQLIRRMVRRLQAKSLDVQVMISLPAHLPVVIADRERIEEVLQNLLDNAVKYSPRPHELAVVCYLTG